jgi:uncharacterized protein
MKNAILLHGTCDKEEYFSDTYQSLSNSHWFPWLQKQLLINDVSTQTPEIPEAYNPQYDLWKSEFERYDVSKETVLVGHSCGGGFLTRWLAENKIEVGKLILVAPWLDPDRSKTTDFFNFAIDPSILSRINEVHLLVSKDDDKDIHQSVSLITKALPNITVHEFEGMGHFTYGGMKTEKFPELLKIILEN